MQFLNHNISPVAWALSLSGWYACRTLWLDEAFLWAWRFYSAGPRWIAPVKWQSRWSVFAVMVNEENDSGFENVLMMPLETQIPLNLEEAVFPSQPHWLLVPCRDSHVARISPWRWYEIMLSRVQCAWGHSLSSVSKQDWITAFFFYDNTKTFGCRHFIEQRIVPVSATLTVHTKLILRLREKQAMHIAWQMVLPRSYGSF